MSFYDVDGILGNNRGGGGGGDGRLYVYIHVGFWAMPSHIAYRIPTLQFDAKMSKTTFSKVFS